MEKSNNSEVEKKSRVRTKNYTIQEKELIFTIVNKYKNVVENKKSDAVSVGEKNNAWVKITKQFNSTTPNLCRRSMESLNKYYENKILNMLKVG